MNDQMQALARRAVACRHWRWMAGMLLQDGRRVVSHTRDGHEILYRRHDGSTIVGCYGPLAEGNCLPDLTDPATLGCLMALVREAWQDSDLVVERTPDWAACRWRIDRGMQGFYGNTEAEALVAALEAAP